MLRKQIRGGNYTFVYRDLSLKCASVGVLCWTTTRQTRHNACEGARDASLDETAPPHIYFIGIFCGLPSLARVRRPSNRERLRLLAYSNAALNCSLFFPLFFFYPTIASAHIPLYVYISTRAHRRRYRVECSALKMRGYVQMSICNLPWNSHGALHICIFACEFTVRWLWLFN